MIKDAHKETDFAFSSIPVDVSRGFFYLCKNKSKNAIASSHTHKRKKKNCILVIENLSFLHGLFGRIKQ